MNLLECIEAFYERVEDKLDDWAALGRTNPNAVGSVAWANKGYDAPARGYSGKGEAYYVVRCSCGLTRMSHENVGTISRCNDCDPPKRLIIYNEFDKSTWRYE